MKISFSQLGQHGRLGNCLFQIAGTLGLGEKYNAEVSFPEWPYDQYFVEPPPRGEMQKNQVKEKHFHYYDWQLTGDSDLFGYLQSHKYFPKKNPFVFKDAYRERVRGYYAHVFEKETIAIQIRRGDYIGNKLYHQLKIHWFITVLTENFNYQDYNIVFFSDDLAYCKVHFECLPNAFFTDDLKDIDQLCLMSMCDNHIISNSSFGFWGAYLSESKKVIHCGQMFEDKFKANDIKDYYPEHWTAHAGGKIDLSDCTFTIPVYFDHTDRKQNLDLCICILQTNFDTNIIIGEQGGAKFEYMSLWCKYMNFDLPNFHRTKMLNDMAIAANTPYLANWDADVIIPPMQIYLTVKKLREGVAMCFPYDGRFARLPRREWFKPIEKLLDIGAIGDTEPKGKRGRPVPESSVGGAVFFNKDSFIDGGMENEYMISFGPEDCERNDRFTKLGFNKDRVGGCLYHIDHWCGPDSSTQNPYFKANHKELEKGRAMTAEELRLYVDSFPWRHKYSSAYYKRIEEGAVRSAKEVYKELDKLIKFKTIIDIGCGVGEWRYKNYTGVDFNSPMKENYIDCDLENDIVTGKYDLCLCLEVAEHISEERADVLIEMLCNLSEKVLFSAAIPHQGGTGHINEQWQSYWEKKFNANGFFAAKIQPDIRGNKEIEFWYRQNIILFQKSNKRYDIYFNTVKDFVLPEYYEQIVTHYKNQLMQLQAQAV